MEIYNVPEERRYWVVRADGGRFYDHFVEYGIIALGHLDILELPEHGDNPFVPDQIPLAQKLFEKHQSEGKKKGTTTSHVNQIKAFIKGMKVGDWVMTIGRRAVRFGRITGTPRLNRKPLGVRYGKKLERVVEMPHNLRRSVAWGPAIKRDSLPFGLLTSMKARQAVFNVNQHWEAIHHSLYPAFMYKDELYLSIRIGTDERINNYHISSLLSYMNEVEVIAKYATEETSPEDFDSFFKEHAMTRGVSTTTKAQFHSAGEIWTAIQAGIAQYPVTMTILGGYILLFGNKLTGFDGLVDIETRRKIWDLLLSRFEKKEMGRIASSLKLSKPQLNTSVLESDEKDEK